MTPVPARAGVAPAATRNAAASQRRDGIESPLSAEDRVSFRAPMMKKGSTSRASRTSERRENRRPLVRRADRAPEDAEQFAPDAGMGRREVGFGMRPSRPDIVRDQDLEPAGRRVEADHVAVPDL